MKRFPALVISAFVALGLVYFVRQREEQGSSSSAAPLSDAGDEQVAPRAGQGSNAGVRNDAAAPSEPAVRAEARAVLELVGRRETGTVSYDQALARLGPGDVPALVLAYRQAEPTDYDRRATLVDAVSGIAGEESTAFLAEVLAAAPADAGERDPRAIHHPEIETSRSLPEIFAMRSLSERARSGHASRSDVKAMLEKALAGKPAPALASRIRRELERL